MNQVKKKRRKKRRKFRITRVKKWVWVALASIILVVALITIPNYRTNKKLKDLGYTTEEIEEIKNLDLTTTIINNQYYTPLLAKVIRNGTYDSQYLPLYLVMDEDTELSEDDYLLYHRLEDKGYEEDQLQNLFSNLYFYEMTPLLVFDYQYNEQPYIDDCLENRETNSETYFVLSNSYVTYYNKPVTLTDINDVTILVNKKRLLTSDSIPTDLVSIDTTYAVDGIYLTQEATNAFWNMAYGASMNGQYIYAVLGYRSYEDQESAYESIAYYSGESYAYATAAQAGSSEHQTGLAVNMSVVGKESEDFSTTTARAWLLENATNYGFIERYPEGKEDITGFPAESDHYRYVGEELAKAIKESNLTYDEYYMLYLAEWNDEAYNPYASSEPENTSIPEATVETTALPAETSTTEEEN